MTTLKIELKDARRELQFIQKELRETRMVVSRLERAEDKIIGNINNLDNRLEEEEYNKRKEEER
jgi:hypothetical protein